MTQHGEPIRTHKPKPATPTLIGPALLRKFRLEWSEEGDKETRGRVLIIGGCEQMPGAVILAAEAALRAGAGKLQIASVRAISGIVAAAVPEARVIGLAQSRQGGISATESKRLSEHAEKADAVLIGPGMIEDAALRKLLIGIISHTTSPLLVLDATALSVLSSISELLRSCSGRTILTPHAGEMARMRSITKETVERNKERIARDESKKYGAVVALKGAETIISSPDGTLFRNRAGNAGLATSGSGDVLAGLITGIAARTGNALTAALWGVHLHALAGDELAKRIGPLGYIAREIAREVPAIMAGIGARR